MKTAIILLLAASTLFSFMALGRAASAQKSITTISDSAEQLVELSERRNNLLFSIETNTEGTQNGVASVAGEVSGLERTVEKVVDAMDEQQKIMREVKNGVHAVSGLLASPLSIRD